jgi:hypothetical protein
VKSRRRRKRARANATTQSEQGKHKSNVSSSSSVLLLLPKSGEVGAVAEAAEGTGFECAKTQTNDEYANRSMIWRAKSSDRRTHCDSHFGLRIYVISGTPPLVMR